MMRVAAARRYLVAGRSLPRTSSRQWLSPRDQCGGCVVKLRHFADQRPVDKAVVPGVEHSTVAGIPLSAVQASSSTTSKIEAIPPSQVPRGPPIPTDVGSQSVPAAPIAPPPKRPRRRFRNFVLSMIILTALGYAGGVYYSLVSDNFHDFFTEYVPYGEDAVGYFEEREFRRRFPSSRDESLAGSRSWPQKRGENKVTIGKQSGMQPRVAEDKIKAGSDLATKGKHMSALEDNTPTPVEVKTQTKAKNATQDNKEAKESTSPITQPTQPQTASTTTPKVSTIDHINVPQAEESVVQDLVKLVNNIIVAVNASSEASKLAPAITTAKDELNRALNQIASMKDLAATEADKKIKNAHSEFDNAAKELVRRVESELQEQESKWREEYESERERLSESYRRKLAAELDAASKVAEEKSKNALLEQEIAMQRIFSDSVRQQVESERGGRLSKLNQLSSSVAELEELTGQWNGVVNATLQTQHLQVALEAIRNKLHGCDSPTPFLNELVALKEMSNDDEVVCAAIASIPPVAYQLGIPSIASLIDRFRRVAAEVRKASLLPEDAGVTSHAASAVLSRLMFQKRSERGLPEGNDVEAVLARTEVLLEEGDLDAATREMNALNGWAGLLSKDWVSECRRVLEVEQAIDVSFLRDAAALAGPAISIEYHTADQYIDHSYSFQIAELDGRLMLCPRLILAVNECALQHTLAAERPLGKQLYK